jgi:hypothetical protein
VGDWCVVSDAGCDADGWQYAAVAKEYAKRTVVSASSFTLLQQSLVFLCRVEPQSPTPTLGPADEWPCAGKNQMVAIASYRCQKAPELQSVRDFTFESLQAFAQQNRPLIWLHDEEEVVVRCM